MHVENLLQLDSLDIALVWGDASLLGQEISGVTATDLEDPTRFLQPGEIVLSGLVWWNPGDSRAKIDRFVSALRTVGAAALLAGEETHGTVPEDLVDSCRQHRIPLLAVSAQTNFRAITEAVYLRQWGDLSRRPAPHYALAENVRNELGRLLELGAAPAELLDRAFAHLGTPPCYLLTSSGRTVARTASASVLPAQQAAKSLRGTSGTTLRIQADGTAYDAWHLHLPGVDEAPPRVLHEIAEVFAQHRHHHDRRQAAGRQAQEDLIALTGTAASDTTAIENALRSCGLAGQGPYRVVIATMRAADGRLGGGEALAEALSHFPSVSTAMGQGPDGEAIAIVHTESDDDIATRLGEVWTLLHDCRPDTALHAGVSALMPTPAGLGAALAQARYALAAARSAAPRGAHVTAVEDLSNLESLLAGVPDDVRAAYRSKTLGQLLGGPASHNTLLETLEVFLAHNCSWARTAEALHLHVNSVHYRIQRVESLTGRDLSRLDHKLDLRAALLCR
ncbi:PucR family transcriptional regulator [Streptomyces sp. NPDC017993]|uniref:PucR family transcriptional regulator n=1 Tax=Streptomyces sp. NPDC017993 TaxID=3365027 RepID=UPI0037977428